MVRFAPTNDTLVAVNVSRKRLGSAQLVRIRTGEPVFSFLRDILESASIVDSSPERVPECSLVRRKRESILVEDS